MLEIEVCEVRGKCPVHKVGDKIVVDDPRIVLYETDALCTHALSSLLSQTSFKSWSFHNRRYSSLSLGICLTLLTIKALKMPIGFLGGLPAPF